MKWRPFGSLGLRVLTEDEARARGTNNIVDEHGVVIGHAVWRAELGKHDCKDSRFGIRAWAATFARAEATVRRLVEKRTKGHAR
jgi:hypothetical protein